jgi:hypothetical protein
VMLWTKGPPSLPSVSCGAAPVDRVQRGASTQIEYILMLQRRCSP